MLFKIRALFKSKSPRVVEGSRIPNLSSGSNKGKTELSTQSTPGRLTGIRLPGQYGLIPNKPISFQPGSDTEPILYLPAHRGWDQRTRIMLYRFLRDNIPAINSAVWTWTRLCASPNYAEIIGTDNSALKARAEKLLVNLDRRLYQHEFTKFGGLDTVLIQFFNSLFTDGAVCGEVVLSPTGDQVDKFYFIDPATIEFKRNTNGQLELWQVTDFKKTKLNPASTFYYGQDTGVESPRGKSLLTAIPFVARVEQRLASDMQKTMHNAGYHRLHVKIKPPEKRDFESDESYIARANVYFEDTVAMMQKIAPEDNPITWNDVEIQYIGPTSQYSASSAWYLNHKAMIEDICAGAHLDPFMLGYSYGTTQHWAGFKFELVQRETISVQRPAKRFVEWLHNLELALAGFDLRTEHHFDNRKGFGLLEQRQAEKIQLENILKMQQAGYLGFEDARRSALEIVRRS